MRRQYSFIVIKETIKYMFFCFNMEYKMMLKIILTVEHAVYPV